MDDAALLIAYAYGRVDGYMAMKKFWRGKSARLCSLGLSAGFKYYRVAVLLHPNIPPTGLSMSDASSRAHLFAELLAIRADIARVSAAIAALRAADVLDRAKLEELLDEWTALNIRAAALRERLGNP